MRRCIPALVLILACASRVPAANDAIVSTEVGLGREGPPSEHTLTEPDASTAEVIDVATPMDVSPITDLTSAEGSAGCGESFIEATYVLPDGTRHENCEPIPQIGLIYAQCMPYSINAETRGAVDRPLVNASSLGNPFRSPGDAVIGFGIHGLARHCGVSAMYCTFNSGPPGCRVRVIQAGREGDMVEAVLTVPCTMPLIAPESMRSVHATLLSARIRGRLVSLGERDSSPDGGFVPTDCAVLP